MYSWRRLLPLTGGLLLYGLLVAAIADSIGLVGEVAIGWTHGRPPAVLVSVDPVLWADGAAPQTAGHRLGPLVASQVRPLERLSLWGLSLPLAINQYTGGLPDWPGRILYALSGSTRAVQLLHVCFGGLLLALVHRFIRFHGTGIAAGIAVLFLATDWSFLFYRRVLGGTELALQAALLLCLWGQWSRRWGGGRHGTWPLAIGVGLGLSAKLTFLLPLVALAVASWLTRRDHPPNRAPAPVRPLLFLGIVGLFLLPLVTSWVHHGGWVPSQPHIHSHDYFSVQLQRVQGALTGQATPSRESLSNLYYWALDPLGFFAKAYAVSDAGGASPWRLVGWLLVLGGAAMAWRDRHPTPSTALLRYMSLLVPTQVLILWLVARDLHHLAMLSPMVAILAGLSIEQLCTLSTPPRSGRRARLSLLLALPWVLSGAHTALRTDETLARTQTPTFTTQGQADLAALLRTNGVQRLVASDYELYGAVELFAPEVSVIHGWGATSHQRGDVLPALLRLAEGGHFLVIRASAPMIYNLRPSRGQLITQAEAIGLQVEEVGRLPDETAVLYRVGPLVRSR